MGIKRKRFFTPEGPQYSDVYEKKTRWTSDLPAEQVTAQLQNFYPQFYSNSTINYEYLKTQMEDAVGQFKKLADQKPMGLFKELYPFDAKIKNGQLSKLTCTPLMEAIKQAYGHNIIAHGVEEMKGGMCNLLMICVTNRVAVDPTGWGEFTDGPSEISPIPHGPYFLIYSTNQNQDPAVRSNLPFTEVQYILVPFDENKAQLVTQLDKLEQVGMIDAAQKNHFVDKLVDYQEFLTHLQKLYPSPQTLKRSSQ